MRTCDSCGFENAEPGKACALCGASEIAAAPTVVSDDVPTLAMPGSRAVSLRDAESVVGRVYAERYRVDALLGSGGMGRVFRVRDLVEERDLALKVLQTPAGEEPDRIERFKREIGILAKLRHPAVPGILGWGTHEGELYFVSELVDGQDLKMEIRRRGPWPPAEAAALVATVAEALGAAHALGIVHRDVKPNNIMIGREGAVRLLDFGLARGVGIDITTLTKTGMIVGTPGYMSPEQFEAQGVDERSDIYSLGVVLFEMLTGRLPFTGQTPIAVALKHKAEPPPTLRSLRTDVPAWLERVVLKCLEKDPARRFPSAAALVAELRRGREGAGPRMRRLPSGDAVVEDFSETSDWALVLQAAQEKTGWAEGMALRFGERYYRLQDIHAPGASTARWTYRFVFWPEGEVFRRIVDYEQDCAERSEAEARRLSSRLSKWISGRKE